MSALNLLIRAASVFLPQLWHESWTGALTLFLVWGITRGLRRLPGAACNWLWRLALLKMLVSLVWTGTLPLRVLPAPIADKVVAITDVPMPGQRLAGFRGPQGYSESAGAASVPVGGGTPPGRTPSIDWLLPALLLAWGAGVVANAILMARGTRRVRLLLRDSTPLRHGPGPEMLPELCEWFDLTRPPCLLRSADGSGPAVVGTRAPALVLPEWILEEGRPEELRVVLAHELAHLHRRDLSWHWVSLAARSLFFFHPLVWLADAELRDSQEAACDAEVLRRLQTPAPTYGRLLVEIAAHCWPQRTTFFPALSASADFAPWKGD